jgi:hypothetical protein
MDDLLLEDGIEVDPNNYVNENNIVDRNLNLEQREDNEKYLYDINNLIVKQVYRENILLAHHDTDDISHDSRTIKFNLKNNKAGGIQFKKNVIGFRLNECIFTSPVFNITDKNKTIKTDLVDITIPKGFYTIFSLLNTLNTSTINGSLVQDYVIFSYDSNTSTVTIEYKNTIEFREINNFDNLIYKLGFRPLDDGDTDNTNLNVTSDINASTHPSLNIGTYLDIVVDEIPYKACKKNPQGLNIVHRLPVRPDSGSSIVYYKSNFIDHNFQYLFYPINLSTLTIHLYMDGEELNLEHMTISFEFELVILNK